MIRVRIADGGGTFNRKATQRTSDLVLHDQKKKPDAVDLLQALVINPTVTQRWPQPWLGFGKIEGKKIL